MPALRGAPRMACKAFASLLVFPAYLLGLVGGLAWRAGQLSVGTYQSAEWKVRRAGAVADLNAAVLGAAVILLLTSRGAFTEAQTKTSTQAWVSQLSEKPVMACNTFNQQAFNGTSCLDPHIHCEPPIGSALKADTKPILINLAKGQNVERVLDILQIYQACDAFSMAVRVQRPGNHTQLSLHVGKVGIASALAEVRKQFLNYVSNFSIMSATLRCQIIETGSTT